MLLYNKFSIKGSLIFLHFFDTGGQKFIYTQKSELP